MTETAVRCSELQRHFTRGAHTVRAVDGVSLEIATGEFVGVVGTSGSGKTTLLNLIGGLDTATSGHLEVMGQRLDALDSRQLALYRRTTVGIVFQAFHLLPARSAFENVELPLLLQNVTPSDRQPTVEAALDQVGLTARRDHLPSELSAGEQQRVAIARAMVKRPRVLLADEPTGNLDRRNSDEILELIQGLNRERELTVIMVSHDEDAVERTAHRAIRLDDGRVVESAAI
jgi:putative ABC transport system ATP-binding protein